MEHSRKMSICPACGFMLLPQQISAHGKICPGGAMLVGRQGKSNNAAPLWLLCPCPNRTRTTTRTMLSCTLAMRMLVTQADTGATTSEIMAATDPTRSTMILTTNLNPDRQVFRPAQYSIGE
jgi:hypothetical protein